MAKHAAPEVEDTTPAPSAQTEVKRSKNYPIIAEHALAFHMLEVFDHVERARRICKGMEQVVHDQLGLDISAKILQLTPANHPAPDTGDMETYDYAILGLFFTNVTRDELESYSAKLLEYFEVKTHQVYTHPDILLPNPHFEVPSADTLRAMTKEANDLRDRTKKFLTADGQINREAVAEAAREYRETGDGDSPETDTKSANPETDKASKRSLNALEDF